MLKKLLGLTPLLLAVTLAGCVDDNESTTPAPNPNDAAAVGFKARFNPAAGIAPFPNDIYISQTDGTLMPPGSYDPASADDANADFGDPMQAMSTLDGWSLNAAIGTSFNDSIDDTSLVGIIPTVQTGSVLVVDVTAAPAVQIPGVDYSLGLSPAQDSAQSILQITPLHPLEPEHTYAIIVTSGVKSVTGDSAGADTAFQAIKDAFEAGTDLSDATLEAIKDAYTPLLTAATAPLTAGGLGIPLDDIAILWTVTTQSKGAVLAEVVTQATASAGEPNGILPLFKVQPSVGDPDGTIFTSKELIEMSLGAPNPALIGSADVYAGAITLPYYSSASAPLTGFWTGAQGSFLTKFNSTPVATGTVTVPMLLTIPNAKGGPTHAGCPGIGGVVIFQHGITQDRTNALAVSETFAAACQAVVAIDLPMHGITDTTSPLYASPTNPLYTSLTNVGFDADAITEATFDLDLANNSTGAEGSDGSIDDSGSHFINLTSLLTSRDNLRQAVSNLVYLAETIPTMDYNIALGAAGADFVGLPISYVGHSLGGIVGSTFLGVYDGPAAATLGMPGGNISQLLLDSPTIGAQVKAGLAANGVIEGTQLFYDFFRNAQTVVDAGDPINYGAEAIANTPIHMIEVVGGAGVPPDQVVPNSATEALATAMGLSCIDATTAPLTGPGIVRFTAGDHSSLLDPTTSAAATVEMQSEMAVFSGSAGTTVFDGAVAPTAGAGTVIQACP